MSWKIIESWENSSREILMFRIKDKIGNTEKVCGVTQTAINDYFRTEDTLEQAKLNFKEHTDFIVGKAIALISNNIENEEGHYIVTSKMINAANIT